jgi:hypothetical protein
MIFMLTELQVDDVVRLRKPHPCGSYEWVVFRIGADIGIECLGCHRRIFLPRRKLAKRIKKIYPSEQAETVSTKDQV